LFFLGLWALSKEGEISNWDVVNPQSSTSSTLTPHSVFSLLSPRSSKSLSTVVPAVPLSAPTSSQKMISVVPVTPVSPKKSSTPRTRRSSIAMLQNLVFDKVIASHGEEEGKIAKTVMNEIKELFNHLGDEILQFDSFYAHSLHENGECFFVFILSLLLSTTASSWFCCCLVSLSFALNIGDKVSSIASLNNNRKMTERLLYLFQKDLLPGLSGEILDNKDSRDHEHLEPVSLLSKIITWIFLGFLNVGMLFYVFLFAVQQGSSKQSAWSQTFLLWLCFDIFFISTGMVVLFHIILPIFIKPDIMKIRKKLIESVVYYYATVEEEEKKILKKGNSDTADDRKSKNGKKSFAKNAKVSIAEKEEKNISSVIPFGGSKVLRPAPLLIPTNSNFGEEEHDDDDEESNSDPSTFNAAKFLFLSYHLASRYPSLKASQIILQFHTIWPRQSYQHLNDLKKAHKNTKSAFIRSLSVVVMFLLTCFLSTPSFLQDMLLHSLLTVSVGYAMILHLDLYRISPLLVILPSIAVAVSLHFLYVSSKKSEIIEKIKLKRFAKRQRNIIKKHGDIRQTAAFMKPLNADSSDSAWSTSDESGEERGAGVLVANTIDDEEGDDEEDGKPKKKMKSIPDYITRKQTLQQGILLSSQLQQIIEEQGEEKEQDRKAVLGGKTKDSDSSDSSTDEEDDRKDSLSSASSLEDSSEHSSAVGDLETGGRGEGRFIRGLTRVEKTRSASSESEESSSNASSSSSSGFEEIGESCDDDEIDHLIRRFHIQGYVTDFVSKASSSVARATEDVDAFLGDEPASEKGFVGNYVNSLISRTSLTLIDKKGDDGDGKQKGRNEEQKKEGEKVGMMSKEEKRKTEIKKKLTRFTTTTFTSTGPVFGKKSIIIDPAKEARVEALRKLKENSIFVKNQPQKRTFLWEKPPSNSFFKKNYENLKKEETNNSSFFFPSHSLMKKVMLQKELSIKSDQMINDDEDDDDDDGDGDDDNNQPDDNSLEESKEERENGESEIRRLSVTNGSEQERRTASSGKKLQNTEHDHSKYHRDRDQEMKESPVLRRTTGLMLNIPVGGFEDNEEEQLKDNSISRSPEIVDGKTGLSKKSRKTKIVKESSSPSSSSRKTRLERVYHQKPAFLESLHNKSKDSEDEDRINPSSIKLGTSSHVKSPSFANSSSSMKRKTNLNNTILSLNPRPSRAAAASSALPYPSFVNTPVAAAPSLSPTSTRKPTQLNDKLSTLKRKISSFKMEVQQLQELSAPSSASSFPSNSVPTTIDESKSVVADETKEEFKIEKEKDVSNI
jgi:hypothetical protein